LNGDYADHATPWQRLNGRTSIAIVYTLKNFVSSKCSMAEGKSTRRSIPERKKLLAKLTEEHQVENALGAVGHTVKAEQSLPQVQDPASADALSCHRPKPAWERT
jgi:hypothetical protein